MPAYDVYLSDNVIEGQREVSIVPHDDEGPSSFVLVGTFENDDGSKVMYHHVRDILYPLGIWDLNNLHISYFGDVIPPPEGGEPDAA